MDKKKTNALVLVGVLNRQKDLESVLKEHWYRIPAKYAPRRQPAYLAFYQTRVFGKDGKAIRYYALIKSFSFLRRAKLLPEEKDHPRAHKYYYKFNLSKTKRTRHVIRNSSRRRISFGFTTLAKLQQSKQICQLFDIIPVEDIMRRAFQERGIKAVHEYCLMKNNRCRYRLDFALFCRQGKIALECDNEKWHSIPARQVKDRERDRYLTRHGWVVVHLPGQQIQKATNSCLEKVDKIIDDLGGLY